MVNHVWGLVKQMPEEEKAPLCSDDPCVSPMETIIWAMHQARTADPAQRAWWYM